MCGLFLCPFLTDLGIDTGVGPTIFRLFRVFRVFRLFRLHPGLQHMFNSLILSLPSFVNITALLFVLFYVFAVVGVEMFSDVALVPGLLDNDTNFRTWQNAMLSLFR